MKSAAILRADLEFALGSRVAGHLTWRERPAPELVPTGIGELDALTGGLPRGAITEIHGAVSSGRTSLLYSALHAAAEREEICALVDATDAFDPSSATQAGVSLANLLWIRCGGNAEHSMKSADLLIQGGGFGVVALDLGDVPPEITRRIPLASWFRFRRAIENTPAVMIVVEREHTLQSCASLMVEMQRESTEWSGSRSCSRLLRGAHIGVRKPADSERTSFRVKAAG